MISTRPWCDHPVSEVMSPVPIKAPPDRQICHAQRGMQIAGVRHLPVIDDAGRLIGILSDRDIWRGLAGKAGPCDPIEKIMTRRVCAVGPDERLFDALNLMLERKISALPVISRDDQVVGILTVTDLLVLLRALTVGATPHQRHAGV
jgi:acetoin utilization protein AcuB